MSDKTYSAPTIKYPECPPVGTVLYAPPQAIRPHPTVLVVGRVDEDGGFLDETGGGINLAWNSVLDKWGTLTVLGVIPGYASAVWDDDARVEA